MYVEMSWRGAFAMMGAMLGRILSFHPSHARKDELQSRDEATCSILSKRVESYAVVVAHTATTSL